MYGALCLAILALRIDLVAVPPYCRLHLWQLPLPFRRQRHSGMAMCSDYMWQPGIMEGGVPSGGGGSNLHELTCAAFFGPGVLCRCSRLRCAVTCAPT